MSLKSVRSQYFYYISIPLLSQKSVKKDQKENYFKQNLSTSLKLSAYILVEKIESGVTEHPDFEHREKCFFNGVLWIVLVQVK